MNNDRLADLLAEQILGWRATADRYQTEDRRWLPRWRFQPCKNIQSAMTLLSASTVEAYSMGWEKKGVHWAKVRVGGSIGKARDESGARAICLALARALRILACDVETAPENRAGFGVSAKQPHAKRT